MKKLIKTNGCAILAFVLAIVMCILPILHDAHPAVVQTEMPVRTISVRQRARTF